jgi:3'-phosphoadenosine 5'-phosphosulfate synthase
VNWLQVIGEGWAAPLKGFMREGVLLQTIHFNSVLVDPFNLTGSKGILEQPTDFFAFNRTLPPKRVSMSVPIILPITAYTKAAIDKGTRNAVSAIHY